MRPRVSKPLLKWFTRYSSWYLRRHFHALHLLQLGDLSAVNGLPMLVCVNHPSWWDPLVGLVISQRFFPEREQYAAMAAEAVEKYKFFSKLGFIGIQSGNAIGFLRTATEILSDPNTALWLTPQAHFTDVRGEVRLAAGAGHIVAKVGKLAILPIALEYAFWTERTPEAFACIGSAIVAEGRHHTAAEWTRIFTDALVNTQSALSKKVIARDPAAFKPLLEGRAGVGGIYDSWRAIRARAAGRSFRAEHGRF